MGRYLVRRLLLIIPTLLIASILVALLTQLLPGDVIELLAGGRGRSRVQDQTAKELIRARLGLDRPFPVQYFQWLVGWPRTSGYLLKSSDAGERWGRLGVQREATLEDLTFVTPSKGWAVGGRWVFHSSDGGRVWVAQASAPKPLHHIFMLDEDYGWVVGEGGSILHTTRGGRPLRTPEGKETPSWIPQEAPTKATLRAVFFVDRSRGWVVGDQGTLLYTPDGGQTWRAQEALTRADLLALAFAGGGQRGVVVGRKGTLLYTSDGGQTWQKVETGTSAALRGVAFDPSGRAWVVGEGGTVLLSPNGGQEWHQVTLEPGLKADLYSVAFGGGGFAIISGERGLLFISRDGGQTWARTPIRLQVRKGGETATQEVGLTLEDASVVTSSRGTVRVWLAGVERRWEWGVLGGNLGKRFMLGGRPVLRELTRTLGPSTQLMVMSVLLAVMVAIPVGVLAAIRQDTWLDYLGRSVTIGGLAIPSFWLGIMVIIIPSYFFNWVPKVTYVKFFDDPAGNLYYFMLPSIVAGVPAMAEIMRMTRSMMLEVLRQDYIRTAWAKGLRERGVILRHALKNAMIPVITLVGLLVPYQLGQLVVVELIFNVPGIGSLLLQAIEKRDFPVIQGVALFMGVVVVVMNLLVDLAYGWLDPRIRYA